MLHASVCLSIILWLLLLTLFFNELYSLRLNVLANLLSSVMQPFYTEMISYADLEQAEYFLIC